MDPATVEAFAGQSAATRPAAVALVDDLLQRIYGLRRAELVTASYVWGRLDAVGTMRSGMANLWDQARRLRRPALSYRRLVESFQGGRLVKCRGVWIAPQVYFYRVDGQAPVRHLHIDLDYDGCPELVALKHWVKSYHQRGELPPWGRAERDLLARHPARRHDREVLRALGCHVFDSRSSGQHAMVLLREPAAREQVRKTLVQWQLELQGRIECTNVGRLDEDGSWHPQPNLLPFPTCYPHQRPLGPVDEVLALPELHPADLMPRWAPPAMPDERTKPAAEPPPPSQPDSPAPADLAAELQAVIYRTFGLPEAAADQDRSGPSSPTASTRSIELGVTAVPRHCWWQWLHADNKACFEFDPDHYEEQIRAMSPGIPESIIQERILKVEQALEWVAHRAPGTAPPGTDPLGTNSPPTSSTGLGTWITVALQNRLWHEACLAYPENRQTTGEDLKGRRLDIACGLLDLLLEVRHGREPIFFAPLTQQLQRSGFLARHRRLDFAAAKARYVNQVLNRIAPLVRRLRAADGVRQWLHDRYPGQRRGLTLFEARPEFLALLALLPTRTGQATSVFDGGRILAAADNALPAREAVEKPVAPEPPGAQQRIRRRPCRPVRRSIRTAPRRSVVRERPARDATIRSSRKAVTVAVARPP